MLTVARSISWQRIVFKNHSCIRFINSRLLDEWSLPTILLRCYIYESYHFHHPLAPCASPDQLPSSFGLSKSACDNILQCMYGNIVSISRIHTLCWDRYSSPIKIGLGLENKDTGTKSLFAEEALWAMIFLAVLILLVLYRHIYDW